MGILERKKNNMEVYKKLQQQQQQQKLDKVEYNQQNNISSL